MGWLATRAQLRMEMVGCDGVVILGEVGTGDVREVELHGRHWPESAGLAGS